MGYFFSPARIAELSMRVEEKGSEFYALLADRNGNEKIKKLFKFLAEQEVVHRRIFQSMAQALKQEPEYEYSIDLLKDLEGHLGKLIQSAFQLQTTDFHIDQMSRFFDIAINTEETAIKIYEHMKEAYVDKFSQVLTGIIEEERRHKDMLSNVRTKIQS